MIGLNGARLPEAATPYARDSDTSKAAAESMKGAPAGSIRDRVLAAVAAAPNGLTCDALEVSLALPHQTVSARVYDLRNAEAIEDTGARAKTRSGRHAAVYAITAKGRAHLKAIAK